jgi:lipid-A-disaccharide synthase
MNSPENDPIPLEKKAAGGISGSVLVVAGEASGDHHAADLILEIRRQAPGLSFHGMGGRTMREAGVEIVQDLEKMAVMGLAEVAGSLRKALSTYRSLRDSLDSRRPRAVLLVDFPEFNLRLARAARRRGIPVIYFISPQIWAWRAGRVRALARDVNRVVCILPFEAPVYRRHGVRAVYVGHPLIDQSRTAPGREEARRRWGLSPGEPVLAVLPGSRRQEARAMLPVMLQAARRLRRTPGLGRVLLPVASSLGREDLERAAGGDLKGVDLVSDGFFEVLAAADAALVASGTATLAGAVMGTPMVVGYRLHPVTFVLGQYLTRVEHVALVNLVAGRRVVPERLQEDFTAENLVREARRLLGEPAASSSQKEAFRRVREQLGAPGVFRRAAGEVLAGIAEAEDRAREPGEATSVAGRGPGDGPQPPVPV